MDSKPGSPLADCAGIAVLAWLLSIVPSPGLGQIRPPPSAGREMSAVHPASLDEKGMARIVGTIAVTISAIRLKHWGVPGADAAFVPDADRSDYAERIRTASSARALCGALDTAARHDRVIGIASIDGDANLNHRSGDQELMSFVITVATDGPATPGSLYVCSHPIFAMLSRGAYPNESFYQVSDRHDLRWTGYRLSLRPGENGPVHLTARIDASQW